MSSKLNRFTSTSLLVALVGIAGCASSSSDLKQSAAGKVSFEIDQPLATVFDQIAVKADQCNPGLIKGSIFTGPSVEWIVRRQIAPDGQFAEITFLNRMAGAENNYMTTEFKALSSTRTSIVSHYLTGPWQRAAENVKGWVTGGSQSCWLRG